MTFYIENSAVELFGNSVELYGLIAVVGAAVVTVVNTLLAKHRALNASLVFRLTMLFVFGSAAFHIFFQSSVPTFILKTAYASGAIALPFAFRLCGRFFGEDKDAFTSLGILTVLEYSVFTRICCTFGGCCYGPEWSGGVSMVYGKNTHNPLPGATLFPLQPTAALVLFVLAYIAAVIFLKKGSLLLEWAVLALNLACYYAVVLISPTGKGRETEAAVLISVFIAAAATLSVIHIIKSKGVFKNVQT